MRIKHKLFRVKFMLCGCLALSLTGCKAEKIEEKEVVRPVKTIVISTAQKSYQHRKCPPHSKSQPAFEPWRGF